MGVEAPQRIDAAEFDSLRGDPSTDRIARKDQSMQNCDRLQRVTVLIGLCSGAYDATPMALSVSSAKAQA
ncbi:hypothetical protein [Asanoa ishikariensis]|uniref:hypothetical protein n=1 Tax=Asanoa ishikariensis TaxID=137265 RepID=UPI0015A05E67|nr:hypothetical protein [Asanoa ishikariensis]